MGWDFHHTTYPIAQKNYNCDACEQCLDPIALNEFDNDDQKIVIEIFESGYKITKGTRYMKISGMFDGYFTTYRSRLDVHELCKKYDLYYD